MAHRTATTTRTNWPRRGAYCGALLSMGTLSTTLAFGPPGASIEEVEVMPCSAATPTAAPRTVQLAICLDVSGSMSGLIDAARQQLWAVVNELATADPMPDLTVALLTYGHGSYNPEDGWVAVQTPFTQDLDLVSQQLFALTTGGGTEYVGRVLNQADQLGWHPSDDALKLVIVAGNESADQDQEMPFREVCKKLITQGIMVNSIYCGSASDGIAPGWREVAQLADGQFASINHNQAVPDIATPFDEPLAALNTELNATYIPVGAAGKAGWTNQQAQDDNAAAANTTSMAQRVNTKATANYRCSWDLVDACRLGNVKIEEVDVSDLPEALQSLSTEGLAEHVERVAQRRNEIQQQIVALSAQHQEFVQAELERQAIDASKTFGSAVTQAVREQAMARGFAFPEPTETPSESSNEDEEQKEDDC